MRSSAVRMQLTRLGMLFFSAAILMPAALASGLGSSGPQEHRARAARAFTDGILLVHSNSVASDVDDSYRATPAFYYLTGLENTPGSMLAIDGRSGETWLFLESQSSGDVQPGPAAERQLGITHVVGWSDLGSFLSHELASRAVIYVEPGRSTLPDDPGVSPARHLPDWVQVLRSKWPGAEFRSAGKMLDSLMVVEDGPGQRASRAAASATVAAFLAGARAIHPNARQRQVEVAVVEGCWKAGAHGVSFWPWAMGGANGVFPKPFESSERYDHLDAPLRAGDLVRLDVGCEWEHYQGDFGRTIPVSGRYTAEQRELWNIYVDAYQKVASQIRDGLTEDQAFELWRAELVRAGAGAHSALARTAVARWSQRKNVPYWQIHATNLGAAAIEGPLRAGMVIDFEPIASIDGQGYYLEDMFLVGKTRSEVLTRGVPYRAEDIEAFLATHR